MSEQPGLPLTTGEAIYGWATCGHDFRFPLPLARPIPSELWCAQCKRTVALWAQSDKRRNER